MCGINGIVAPGRENLREMVDRMNTAVIHRGPDSGGIHLAPGVCLGMRRLSIIDLAGGHQPIYNEDRTCAIVYNGECYNFREIRDDLTNKGHCFKTASDTEVILHCYEEYGEKCLSMLNGMFAFAIHDTIKDKVFIARDRLGQKPLYYCKTNTSFIFSSELKSILAADSRKRKIDYTALELYLSMTFIPAPYTIFEDIRKLEPGCFAWIDSNTNMNIGRYWELAIGDNKVPEDEAANRVRELVYDSVERRMIADVPFGAFLSGGVDSSIVVSVMADIAPGKVKTFSIANKVKGYDESAKAQFVADRFGAEHTEWQVDSEYMAAIAEKVCLNFDEPFADSSALPSYVVSELTRKKVTVALTGDGGDEIFGGYTRYLMPAYAGRYAKLPKWIREKIIQCAVNGLPVPASLTLRYNKLRKLVTCMAQEPFDQYVHLQQLGFNEAAMKTMFTAGPQQAARALAAGCYNRHDNASPLAKMLFADVCIGLEGDMLAKVDRSSMLCSLEVRNPLLDYRIVEYAFSLPDNYKIRGNRLKHIFKESFKSSFPPHFLDKPKQGFGVPVGEYLKRELKQKMVALLSSDAVIESNVVNVDYVRDLFNRHCAGQYNTFQLWTFFSLAVWLEKNQANIAF